MISALTALGAGSGIDTSTLIDQLVSAERTSRTASLTTRTTAVDARISAMGQIRAGIASIATSLDNRIRQGGLGVVLGSDTASVGIEARGDGPAAPFESAVRVDQLAAFQTLRSVRLASAAAPVGTGSLTLTLGTRTPRADGGFDFAAGVAAPVQIAIGAGDNSLTGLRDAINRAGTSVRASIVADSAGATLVLKGASGAASAFTLTAAADAAAPGLDRFDYRPAAAALTLGSEAVDAQLLVDGVAVRRASNVIDDLLPGARVRLTAAILGQHVDATRSFRHPPPMTALS